MDSKHYKAMKTLGDLYYKMNDLDSSLTYYNKSIDINSRYYKAYYSLSKLLNDQGNTASSIKSLEKEDRNLLKLKKAIYLSEDAEENDLLNLLNPILNSNSVWKYQSLKFIGDYYFDKKEYNKAKQYYSDILMLDNTNSDIKDINRKIKIINNG